MAVGLQLGKRLFSSHTKCAVSMFQYAALTGWQDCNGVSVYSPMSNEQINHGTHEVLHRTSIKYE